MYTLWSQFRFRDDIRRRKAEQERQGSIMPKEWMVFRGLGCQCSFCYSYILVFFFFYDKDLSWKIKWKERSLQTQYGGWIAEEERIRGGVGVTKHQRSDAKGACVGGRAERPSAEGDSEDRRRRFGWDASQTVMNVLDVWGKGSSALDLLNLNSR